ncbi:MAG: hypothetical protein EAZ30_17740 [Betaproteobacteria bacterium]|nr:MAG: hypothetical protein EAZ30_17740 [Betaproteobacteria bacterium]
MGLRTKRGQASFSDVVKRALAAPVVFFLANSVGGVLMVSGAATRSTAFSSPMTRARPGDLTELILSLARYTTFPSTIDQAGGWAVCYVQGGRVPNGALAIDRTATVEGAAAGAMATGISADVAATLYGGLARC